MVFINSVAGEHGYPFSAGYVASKFGMRGLAESLRNELREEIINNQNSIVIIGGILPVYLSGKYFNNKEGGIEDEIIRFEYRHIENKFSFKEGFKKSIFEILDNNKVILIYPIPEVGWNVPNKIFSGKAKVSLF